jgi:hypothetical protein
MANNLPFDRQVEIAAPLTEGVSIRATERLTGVHRDTIMRLGVRVGFGCAAILALAGAAKAIISYRIGKRTAINTRAFVMDVRDRVLGAPEISSDAFNQYPPAVDEAFGLDCTFGTIEKHYSAPQAVEASRRYSPAEVISITTRAVVGRPRQISTSYVERQNLTLRMQQRRFTRLTNGFSKKLENHCAAVALYAAHYNFCRVHEALRITPAMQLGVTDHVWTIGELVDAALNGTLASSQQVA